ncbi:MAG: protein kinase [Lachnospiraceae bacterium]|nr:protein kinase [Lachnospiraceae bacterium]
MGEVLNGYELLGPFQNKDAGFSRWTYARKNGNEYFIKEFLDPIYPVEESLSEDLRKRRIRDCEEHEIRKKQLYEAIRDASDGNLVTISEYFRFDSHYYVSTPRIGPEKISPEAVRNISTEDKIFLCKALSHSMMKFHEVHMVHSDIKADNILLKRTETGKLIGKIIDFDCSFFEDAPPQYEDELGGDQVYLAPESCLFICGSPVKINCKADVFSLGLLFHQYFTGSLPQFDMTEYDYAHEAILDNQKLKLSEDLLPEIKNIIELMLEGEPACRISMKEVFAAFQKLDQDSENVEEEKNADMKNRDQFFYHAGDL